MTSSNCLHSIKIFNLQSNDIIPHQFLLIKGKIEQHKCPQTPTITLCCDNIEFLTTGISEDTGIFKFLLNLGQIASAVSKEVLLKFQYCNAKTELTLNYKPKISSYKIQPLIIIAQDESSNDQKVRLYQEIIDLNLLLIQSVYGEKLKEAGKDRLCFEFNGKCEIFNCHLSKEHIWQMTEHELWSSLAKELLKSEWGAKSQLKFVAFIACSKYLGAEVVKSGDFSYNNIKQHIQGHAACGAGGLALFSSTYFYAWPQYFKDIFKCFANTQALDLAKEPDDSNYRKTRGGVYASSLGAVCHEIGHIFDLGHDLEGVMGSNFDYINHIFTIKQKTEHLPERIIGVAKPQLENKPRFTQLKKTPGKNFLDCYREQKTNDSFYFSPNSAIILAHHPWLNGQSDDIIDNNDFDVKFNADTMVLESKTYPLKIIEIRKDSNSLVTEWLEFQKNAKDKPVFHYNLSKLTQKSLKDSHVFVMSCCGHCKKIEI